MLFKSDYAHILAAQGNYIYAWLACMMDDYESLLRGTKDVGGPMDGVAYPSISEFNYSV